NQKVLIGLSIGSVFLAIIALLLTQLINANASFHNFKCSKRMVECLLVFDILSVVLALITLALFLGINGLQTLTAYGFSFWSFVAGTCCVFLSCIVTAVYRIDVEFEFRRYRHDIIEQIDQDSVRFSFTNGSLEVLIRNGDLSQEPCDAVVNPTNESMVPDGGVDVLIHQQMGQFFTDQVVAIHKEMKNQSCPVGQSRIFIAKFNRAEHDPRFVISTVGPVYEESEKERAAFLLQSCYYTSLALANIYQLASIAYPAISCGTNQFPVHEAARVAIESIRRFSFNVKEVRFVLYERSTFDVFIREWTDYAQQVNKEANIGDQITDAISEPPKKSTSKPPVPLKPKTRFCVLCKQNMLPTGRTILCLACSQLTRAQVFKMFLSNLRTASENSYNDLAKECQLLQTVLSLYPLIYT
ncbi:unnamed protein product, partial [Rotaria magnacalcarata]